MISINGYFMYYEDQLVNTGKLNDVGAYIRTNVDESYRTGVEITGMSNFGNGFLLTAHYQLVITKLLDMMNMSTIGIHHMNKLL